MIARWYPEHRKVELFAREKTEGWDVWGNEVASDISLPNAQGDSQSPAKNL
jgi:N6-adenosine-specific RNA methylase IME4